jgi:hypothetical protein
MFLSHKTWFFKYRIPPKWQKAIFPQNTGIYAQNVIVALVLKKIAICCRKMVKIAKTMIMASTPVLKISLPF